MLRKIIDESIRSFGTPEHIFELAQKYEEGTGDYPKDPERAVYFYQWATYQHHYAPAQRKLAMLLEEGQLGLQQNLSEAISLYCASMPETKTYNTKDLYLQNAEFYFRLGKLYIQQAASEETCRKGFYLCNYSSNHLPKAKTFLDAQIQNNSDFQYIVAREYELGNGQFVDRNLPEAFTLYTLSAKNGNARASHRLGYFYETGQGNIVTKDLPEAVRLYQLAMTNKVDGAEASLDNLILQTKRDYQSVRSQLKLNQDFLDLLAHNGCMLAQFDLAYSYHKQKPATAARLYLALINTLQQGYASIDSQLIASYAAYNLALIYESGRESNEERESVAKNLPEAVKLYEFAREKYPDALINLIKIYSAENKDVPKDLEKAVRLCQEALRLVQDQSKLSGIDQAVREKALEMNKVQEIENNILSLSKNKYLTRITIPDINDTSQRTDQHEQKVEYYTDRRNSYEPPSYKSQYITKQETQEETLSRRQRALNNLLRDLTNSINFCNENLKTNVDHTVFTELFILLMDILQNRANHVNTQGLSIDQLLCNKMLEQCFKLANNFGNKGDPSCLILAAKRGYTEAKDSLEKLQHPAQSPGTNSANSATYGIFGQQDKSNGDASATTIRPT